jgi:SAM-dependent methyltransferase
MGTFLGYFKHTVLDHGTRHDFLRNLKAPARVLDLGCGGGYNSTVLIEHHPDLEIHGIDLIDESAVPSFITYKKIDLNRAEMPYPDGYFDAIVCTHVIEHLIAPMNLGPEINRVLKPSGSIYVEAPNWTSMLVPSFGFKREQHDPFNFFDDPSHIRPWTRHGLFAFLSQSCALEVKEVGTVRNWRRIPFDGPILIYGLVRGKRGLVVSSFWNIYGWSIYGVAEKSA